MAENNSSAPLKTAEGAAPLWCVHVTGADDVHPMPSRKVALEEANALNTSICRIKRQDIDPVLIAVVAEWPHSADSHAAGLMIRDECLRMRGDQAVAAQAAPAEVMPCGVCGAEEAFTGSCGGGRSNPRAHCFERAALAATPALPATEDSSAGDLAEVQAEPVAEARVGQDEAGKKTVELELRYGELPPGIHQLYTAPQAQPADALDAETIKKAARYDYLRENCVREWVSRLEATKGKKTLDIEFDADGHDLDIALDAAMAAAQEGGNASSGKDGAA
ncbi:hypothetical protein [Comamonas sp. JUb58]|uniref:hypothetical protein n=1 Tax=Comamonas sp. JUb58 TaxID=2485114 RepID=UPI00105C7129|nr:hypothetical protein [Comamonas sp. JUb58]TDS82581.1 hypothetical protein EDF71_107217 [Comamonas sp. JUb58]